MTRTPLRTSIWPLTCAVALGLLVGLSGCNSQPKSSHWTGGSPTQHAGNAANAGTPGAGTPGAAAPAAARRTETAPARPGTANPKRPRVVFRTTLGSFLVELYADKAPVTVRNFLRYVDEKFYDGTIFHRVIANFMIQGGGFTKDLQKKPTHAPIRNEADNGLSNQRGTIAMARTPVVDSATAQFFINVKDNPALDHRGPGPAFGYAVFGRVVQGMDVVDRIRRTPVAPKGPMFQHLPVTPVVIESVRRLR